MSNKEKATKISWLTLAFMAFSTVWGFGNITNGFVYFNGPQVIFSWIFMFALYFIPYALMVGELGSAFKNEGGVSVHGCTRPPTPSWLTTPAGPTGRATSPTSPARAAAF